MARKKIKIIEANAKTSELIQRLDGFSLRFNVNILKNGFTQFQNRCISAIGAFIGGDTSKYNWVARNVYDLLGIPFSWDQLYTNYSLSELYHLLTSSKLQISDDASLFRWLMILESVLAADPSDSYGTETLTYDIAEALKISGINAILCDTADGYLFYPANAELLDQKIVVDTLNWLNSYPKAKEQYNSALRMYLKDDHSRNIVDALRLSVELFLKQLLQNGSSLEHQLIAIGDYLKGKNIAAEIRNMFVKLLDCFAKYNNKHIKHNDDSNSLTSAELEYLIYLSGTFMRFLMQVDKQ